MERLLLIEFASMARPIRAIAFPSLLGLARAEGVPARWLRFAVPVDARFRDGTDGQGLSAAEVETLQDAWAAFRPTRVVFSGIPSSELADRIAGFTPRAQVVVVHQRTGVGASPGPFPALAPQAGPARRFLGLPPAPDDSLPLEAAATPDFGFVAANPAAAAEPPLPYLALEASCRYHAPVGRNPAYSGVDLSGCAETGGCAFCNQRDPAGTGVRWSPARARVWLDALSRTLPPREGRLEVRILGGTVLSWIESFADLLATAGVPAADWLLDPRADDLVRGRAALERALLRLDGTGHRIEVSLVGIENFSPDELLRFNKGFSPTTALEAVRCLLELERDFRATFGFRRHGGLSLILFTPWTTLGDLSLNYRILWESGMDMLSGKVLDGRLRLSPDLPIAALALRDGLVADRYDDPLFDTAARTMYEAELPWRFRDSRVDAVCRVVVRLHRDDGFPRDELDVRVQTLEESGRFVGLAPLEVALMAVDEAERVTAGGGDAASGIDRALRLVDAVARRIVRYRDGEHDAGAGTWSFRPDRPKGPRRLVALTAAMGDQMAGLLGAATRHGFKPVGKVEGIRRDEARRLVSSHRLPNPRIRPSRTIGGEVELYFGRRDEDVRAAVALTIDEEDPDSVANAPDRRLAIGRLLGYPSCCVEAYSTQPAFDREVDTLGHWRRRLEDPREAAAADTPWPLLGVVPVPCRLGCEAWRRMSAGFHRVAAEALGDDWAARAEDASRNPWLVMPHLDFACLELVPVDPPGPRFRIRAGMGQLAPADLEIARTADEIVVEPERLFLLRDGRRLADWSMRAFLWWYRESFQALFWRQLLAVRQLSLASGSARDGATTLIDSCAAFDRRFPGFCDMMRSLLAEVGDDALRVEVPDGDAAIRATVFTFRLVSGGVSVGMEAQPTSVAENWLFRTGSIAFFHSADESIQAPERRRVVARFSRRMSAVMRRRREGMPSDPGAG